MSETPWKDWRELTVLEVVEWCRGRSVAGRPHYVPGVESVQLFSDGSAFRCEYRADGPSSFSVSEPVIEGCHLTITNQNTGFVLTTP